MADRRERAGYAVGDVWGGEGRGIVGMGKGGWGGRLPCDCDEEKHKVSRKFVREQ